MAYIRSLFQLTSPLHVTAFDADKTGPKATMTRPVRDSQGKKQALPIFPANDVRGRLRRKAASLIMDAIREKGEKLNFAAYMGLQCGTASASPETGSLSVEEAVRARRHVYMGLFGGGMRVLPSGYFASDLVPVTVETIKLGMVPEKEELEHYGGCVVQHGSSDYELCCVIDMTRRDPVSRMDEVGHLMSTVADWETSLSEYIEKAEGSKQARKDKVEGAKKTDAANMFSVQAVSPGVSLWSDIRLSDSLTLAQVGLLLHALSALVKENALGGLSSKGLGRFRVNGMKISHPAIADGDEISVLDERGEVSPQLAFVMDALRAEIDDLNTQELGSYFTTSKE